MIIDPHSKVPLYFQLKEEIRKLILDGTFKEGDLVPSERELSERYDLSSTTIRRALNDLVHENLLERKAGKGTFVRVPKVKRDLRKVLGFTANMQEMGLVPTTKVLSKKVTQVNAFARKRLGLKKGEKILRLNRLRFANNIPMMLETRYIRVDLCPGVEKHELNSSLWTVFEHDFGCKPCRHSQNVNITTVSAGQGELLGIQEGAAVFLIRGVTYLRDDEPIECEESLYRSDKYDLAFEAFLEEV